MYTKEEIKKAGKIGEVSMIDVRHVVSLLDEARAQMKQKKVVKQSNSALILRISKLESANKELQKQLDKIQEDRADYASTDLLFTKKAIKTFKEQKEQIEKIESMTNNLRGNFNKNTWSIDAKLLAQKDVINNHDNRIKELTIRQNDQQGHKFFVYVIGIVALSISVVNFVINWL